MKIYETKLKTKAMPGLQQFWEPIPAQVEFYYDNGVLTPTFSTQVVFKIIDADTILSELDQSGNPKYSNTSLGCRLSYYGSTVEWVNPSCYTNMGYPTQEGVKDFHYDGMSFTYTPIFQDLNLLPAGDHIFIHSFVVYGLTWFDNLWVPASEYTFQTIMHVSGVAPPPINTPPTFTPTSLAFTHTKGDTLPSKSLDITGSSWKVTGRPNFIFSSPSPGVSLTVEFSPTGPYNVITGSGSAIVNIKLSGYYDQTAIFLPEDLNTVFNVTNLLNERDVAIPVTVEVKSLDDFLVLPNADGEFAFTLDPEYYKVKTNYKDTYFQFDTTVKTYNYLTHEETLTFIPQRIVPFKGNGQINLGKVIHRLMHKIGQPNEQELQYQEAKIQVVCTEKILATDAVIRSGTTNWISYVAGLSRGNATNGFLDFNPKPNRVTQNSFAYLNVLVNEPNYEIRLLKNGTLLTTLPLPDPNGKIMTKKITFQDLTKGDVLECLLDKVGENNTGVASKKYIVFPDSFYSCHLIWENEFKLQSALECTGTASIKTDFESLEQKLFQNLVEIVETVESTKEVKVTLNTGWLLETDVDTVESLLRSPRIWMQKNNQVIALRSKPKSMVNRDHERELIEYTLEFTINRAYDEETYTL